MLKLLLLFLQLSKLIATYVTRKQLDDARASGTDTGLAEEFLLFQRLQTEKVDAAKKARAAADAAAAGGVSDPNDRASRSAANDRPGSNTSPTQLRLF